MSGTSTDRSEQERRADVYRRAARAMEREESGWGGAVIDYACEALDVAGDRDECSAMKSVYAPRSASITWLALGPDVSERDPQQLSFRILALCFMAAMVEAGDA